MVNKVGGGKKKNKKTNKNFWKVKKKKKKNLHSTSNWKQPFHQNQIISQVRVIMEVLLSKIY